MSTPDEEMLRRRKFLSDSTTQAITTTPALVGPLAIGALYDLYSDADCRWIQGPSGVVMADNTHGRPHPARTFIESVFVESAADAYFKIATTSGLGTFEFIKRT